jgi:ABC-type transporter Mla subunit MlaD
MVSGNITPPKSARRVGRIVAAALVMLAAGIFFADRFSGLDYRCLILSRTGNLRELQEKDRVIYRGSEIGYLERVRPEPGQELRFNLRMRVKCSAWNQIPLDAAVRIEPQGTNQPYVVNILPGRESPPDDYPGKVKVLPEVTAEDQFMRALRDVLDGVADVSKAKGTEQELEQLQEENQKLKQELKNLKGR